MIRKMSFSLAITSVLFTILSAEFAFAINPGVGTSGAQFLCMGVNARAIAMGEAYSAVSEDASALYWNPAGLGLLDKKSLSMMHSSYLQNIFYDYGSYAHPLSKYGTAAVSFQYLSSPRINQTDDVGTDLGTFRISENAFTLGYGKYFAGPRVSAGFNGKFIQSKVVETATAFAADIGFIWYPSDKMQFGAAAQNMGSRLQFVKKSEPLPFNLKFGSAFRYWKPLLTTLDMNFPRDNDPFAAFGSEYKYNIGQKMSVSGRIGFNSRTTSDINGINSFSTGIGLAFGAFEWFFGPAPAAPTVTAYRQILN